MLQIVEIITRTVQGLTEPMICRAEDDQLYVVKGRNALCRGLICEVVSVELGRAFDLPVPDYTLVEMPDELCRYDRDLQQRFGGIPCFASKHIPNLQEFDRSSISPTHQKTLQDIFLFDYWIKNDDRHFTREYGGNPNLLVDPGREHITVIDHNMAFSKHFDLTAFLATHVGRSAWFDQQCDMLRSQSYQPRMKQALALCADVRNKIPAEWFAGDSTVEANFLAILEDQLAQFESDAFWEPLK